MTKTKSGQLVHGISEAGNRNGTESGLPTSYDELSLSNRDCSDQSDQSSYFHRHHKQCLCKVIITGVKFHFGDVL